MNARGFDADFARLLVDPDPTLAAEGWRLRVLGEEFSEGGMAALSVIRERVLPEQVANPEARAVLEVRDFGLMTRTEAEWLYAVLGEALGREGG